MSDLDHRRVPASAEETRPALDLRCPLCQRMVRKVTSTGPRPEDYRCDDCLDADEVAPEWAPTGGLY